MEGRKQFWERIFLKNMKDDCIYHCIVPMRLYDYFDIFTPPGSREEQDVIRARFDHTKCSKCDHDLCPGEYHTKAARIMIARQLCNGGTCYFWRFGIGNASLCSACDPAPEEAKVCIPSETLCDYFEFTERLANQYAMQLSTSMTTIHPPIDVIIRTITHNTDDHHYKDLLSSIKSACHGKGNICLECSGKSQNKVSACSRCKTIAYCSKECQAEDWPRHKLVCSKLKDQTRIFTNVHLEIK